MRLAKIVASTVCVGLVALLLALTYASRSQSVDVYTIELSDTTGLYVGNEVQLVGVRVGEVTAIEPDGLSSKVTVEVAKDVAIAKDTGVVVMQSSLVTDRFIEFTAAGSEESRLADGARIGLERTKSPANVDDLFAAINELTEVLGEDGKSGIDLGDVLEVGAEQLDGKGKLIADALAASDDALGTLGGREDDVEQIVTDLDSVIAMLAKRDSTIGELTDSVFVSTNLLNSQRDDLIASMKDIDALARSATDFVKTNRKVVRSDLQKSEKLLRIAADRTDAIAETFDNFPLLAENIVRSYDRTTRSMRIRLDVRDTGPFSAIGRAELCKLLSVPRCDLVTAPDGSGLLDPLLNWVPELFPEDL